MNVVDTYTKHINARILLAMIKNKDLTVTFDYYLKLKKRAGIR